MKPILQALLLADKVYCDAQTGKSIICGTFRNFVFGNAEVEVDESGAARLSPMDVHRSGSPWVYMSLTEISEPTKLTLQYVNLQRDHVLFKCELEVRCEDPLESVEIAFAMPELPNVAGVHVLELLWENEPLGSHRITVREIKNGGN